MKPRGPSWASLGEYKWSCTLRCHDRKSLSPGWGAARLHSTSAESPAWVEHAAGIRQRRARHTVEVLEGRGLIKAIAGDRDRLIERLTAQRVSAYSGIDPTAPSLHLGHLIPLNALFWLFACGHTAISLVGNATAKIGDPTDRLKPRAGLEKEEQRSHAERMKKQLKSIWSNVETLLEEQGRNMSETVFGARQDLGPRKQIEYNDRWLSKITLPQYLRTVGQCAKVGAMLSRDTVRNRLEKGESMTLAEFNYPLVQALDWFHMFAEKGTEIQIGGSDQYGNIVAGIDYINYMQRNCPDECHIGKPTLGADRKAAYGITTPLLQSSSGEKIGKSAGNAVWLDAAMTSPFELYGHLLRTADDDVEQFLRLLTLVPMEQIARTMEVQRQNPAKRNAQHLLAREICLVAHGKSVTMETIAQHEASRSSSLGNVVADLRDKKDDKHYLPQSLVMATPLTNLASIVGLTSSVKEARRLREQGGLYVSAATGQDSAQVAFQQLSAGLGVEEALIEGRYLVLRSGKWKTARIEVLSDEEFGRRGLEVAGMVDWRGKVEERRRMTTAKEAGL